MVSIAADRRIPANPLAFFLFSQVLSARGGFSIGGPKAPYGKVLASKLWAARNSGVADSGRGIDKDEIFVGSCSRTGRHQRERPGAAEQYNQS